MTIWEQFGLFALKFGLIFFCLVAFILLIVALVSKSQSGKISVQVQNLSDEVKKQSLFIKSHFHMNKEEVKALKKQNKEEAKSEKEKTLPRCFILDFDGDVQATQVEQLAREVTAVLSVATPQDQVIVRVESPGGVVHGYGLAAAQLLRIRNKNIPLAICVDKVAASGGYLMACTANKIIAAPFAILGSIGVVAQVPNFNKLLKKYDVEYKEYTAGAYKRTVSLLGEITEKGEQKFKEQLEDTHLLFKDFVSHMRPQLNIEAVATGEYWYGNTAVKLGLADSIQTSNEYLLDLVKHYDLIHVSIEEKQSLQDKLSDFLGQSLEKALTKILDLSARSKLN